MADKKLEGTVVGEKLRNRVVEIIMEQLGILHKEVVTLEAELAADLGASGLKITEIFLALQDEFGVRFPDKEAEKLTTVGKLLAYLERNGASIQ